MEYGSNQKCMIVVEAVNIHRLKPLKKKKQIARNDGKSNEVS